MEKRIPIVGIVGPTATGKTALGIALAKIYGGEILSCDSMQIYEGLSIGTAKPSSEELSQISHHLLGFCPLETDFSVSDYVLKAAEAAADMTARGKRVFLVGGTGLYARSFLKGISFDDNCRDDELRNRLIERTENGEGEKLYEELQQLDPAGARGIHPNNLKRVIRALEYCLTTGEPFSGQAQRSKALSDPYSYLMLCLSFRDRAKLYHRIDLRVDKMMEEGLLEEAEGFYRFIKKSGKGFTAAQAIGYKELFSYFDGEASLEEAVDHIKRETRRYAKRQLTWFRREEKIRFLYVDDYPDFSGVLVAAQKEIEDSNLFL